MAELYGDDRSFDLTIFRVEEGLGNACLLVLPDRRAAVIDWGTQDPATVKAAFDTIGAGPIAFVAATHAHADHTLGIRSLLDEAQRRGVRVEHFAYPATSLHKREAYLTRARERAVELKIPCSQVSIDEFDGPDGPRQPPWLAWGDGWDVRVLSPGGVGVSRSEIKSLRANVVPGNDTSMVILFRFTGNPTCGRGLLTGDATPATLQTALRTSEQFEELSLKNDCLVAPHHGAKNGLPPWLLELSRGAIAISGRTDSPHHPSQATLTAAAQACSKIGGALYCTSYAQACRDTFGSAAPLKDRHLVTPGRCFGDITFEVRELAGTRFKASSDGGAARRAYGLCSAKLPMASAEVSRRL